MQIPIEEVDKSLPEKLKKESAGILAWLIEGCTEWQKEGLSEPEEVKRATQDYRSDMDSIAHFMEDCLTFTGQDEDLLSTKEIRTVYENWCIDNGEQPISKKAMGTRLGKKAEPVKSKGVRGYLGVLLLNDSTPEASSPPKHSSNDAGLPF